MAASIKVKDTSQRVQVPNNLRSLAPNTIKNLAFGIRNLKYWILGPSRLYSTTDLDGGVASFRPISSNGLVCGRRHPPLRKEQEDDIGYYISYSHSSGR